MNQTAGKGEPRVNAKNTVSREEEKKKKHFHD